MFLLATQLMVLQYPKPYGHLLAHRIQVTIEGLALSTTRHAMTQGRTSMLAVLQIECSFARAGLVAAVRMNRQLFSWASG